MKLLFVLIQFLLQGGVIKEPFRIADAEPEHHQVSMRAAMAADGRFAIAWIDSLQLPDRFVLDIYIRFFDRNGNPLCNPYGILKPYDTTWVNFPTLDMDSSGNTVLVWTQGQTLSDTKLSDLRFQYFTPGAVPAGPPKTLYSSKSLETQTCVSLNNNGVFAVACYFSRNEERGNSIWVQRFDLDGIPQDSAFMALNSYESFLPYDTIKACLPRIALNDAGEIVVTWFEAHYTAHNYPRYQVFDKDDKPILPWEPKGHRLDDGDSLAGACRPDPCWIDNDGFVAFWTDYCIPPYTNPTPLLGRVFSQRGAVKHPVRILAIDTTFCNASDSRGRFYTAVLPDGRFAETHTKSYWYGPDTLLPERWKSWEHAGGILGQVVNNEPWRRTTLFEYSTPFGFDTLFTYWSFFEHYDTPPAVAACNDRLIWVYPRFNPDTIFEAWAVISDWDMGVPSSETPASVTHLEIANSIGREIVLRYSDCPEGFKASVFDASGRKVDELRSTERSGMIVWGECYGPGMYFIVPKESKGNPLKVVLVR